MQYTSHIEWQRNDVPFTAKTYDRTHRIQFNGGVDISASSAPEFLGKSELPNPEELFTAAISSCLMLTFLYMAALKNIVIEAYSAIAVGTLEKNNDGKMAVTQVVIKPTIKFAAEKPDAAVLKELFNKAHENCFISTSVKTTVTIEL